MRRARFFLIAVGASCAIPSHANGGSGPSPNWSTATAVPEHVPQQMNILRLDGARLLWNGMPTSETNVREYLALIVNHMNPQPLIILSYSAQTPQARIERARLLVDEIIQCTPSECLEVTIARP